MANVNMKQDGIDGLESTLSSMRIKDFKSITFPPSKISDQESLTLKIHDGLYEPELNFISDLCCDFNVIGITSDHYRVFISMSPNNKDVSDTMSEIHYILSGMWRNKNHVSHLGYKYECTDFEILASHTLMPDLRPAKIWINLSLKAV